MSTAIGAAAWAAGVLLLAGCHSHGGVFGPGIEATEGFEVSAAGANGLAVETDAGSIGALTEEKGDGVLVNVVKMARTSEDLARIRIIGERRGDEVFVGYTVDGDDDGISVSFYVISPPALHARLRSGAGSIRAEGFQGGVDARSGAGSVESISVKGDQSLESGAGSIRVTGADGCVRAESGAGSIRASGRLRGASSLETSAGSIEVYLHPDARLKVTGKTSAGSVRTDFPLAVAGASASKELAGTIGDGSDGSLRIESSAGSLAVLKQ